MTHGLRLISLACPDAYGTFVYESIDRFALKSRIEKNRTTVSTNIRGRTKLILGKSSKSRGPGCKDQAYAGSVLADGAPGSLDVNIVQPAPGSENPLGDDVRRMKTREPHFARLGQEHFAHLRNKRVGGVSAFGEICEPRVTGKVVSFDRGAEPLILGLVHQGDH